MATPPSLSDSSSVTSTVSINSAIPQSHVAIVNGTRVIIDPASLSSIMTPTSAVSSNASIISPNNANAAATAAAIALTNLQNKFEIHNQSSQQSVLQPTVIVQAPTNASTSSSVITDQIMPRVVLCSSGKPVTLSSPLVTLAKEMKSESSSSTTLSKVNIISRPIDLLTSAALAAAAVNNESISTSSIPPYTTALKTENDSPTSNTTSSSTNSTSTTVSTHQHIMSNSANITLNAKNSADSPSANNTIINYSNNTAFTKRTLTDNSLNCETTVKRIKVDDGGDSVKN